jgi:hypothetical protein
VSGAGVPGWQDIRTPGDLATRSEGLDLFARIEGLVGEEHALLRIPAERRTDHEHARLREIGAELDRIWERLRERAERLGVPGSGQPAS